MSSVKFAIGDKVKIIKLNDGKIDFSKFLGTTGTVLSFDFYHNHETDTVHTYYELDNGFCFFEEELALEAEDPSVEYSYSAERYGAILAIKITLDDKATPQATLISAYGKEFHIQWNMPSKVAEFEQGITGYTLFYDERPKRPFNEW